MVRPGINFGNGWNMEMVMARKNVGKSGETGERSVDHDMMLQGRSENSDQEKFAQYVKAHGADSQFLTLEDERHLLRAAVARFDISFDEARWLASGSGSKKFSVNG